jgi:hypothetical protein
MAHVRTEFSDRQKAEIFARDRATCCFSGANLWLLDAPLRPGYQMDWVDHIKPSSRGGKAELSNGVSASHTFNSKKRNNSADTGYLFIEGRPSATYFEIFGALDGTSLRRLDRLQKLSGFDWYFNRAIANILLGFDWRCEKKRGGAVYKRDDLYWFKAGFNRLHIFLKNVEVSSFEKRQLLTESTERCWLDLADVETLKDMQEVAEQIFPIYQRNYDAWVAWFWDAKSASELETAYREARDQNVDQRIVRCMEQDRRFLSSRPVITSMPDMKDSRS